MSATSPALAPAAKSRPRRLEAGPRAPRPGAGKRSLIALLLSAPLALAVLAGVVRPQTLGGGAGAVSVRSKDSVSAGIEAPVPAASESALRAEQAREARMDGEVGATSARQSSPPYVPHEVVLQLLPGTDPSAAVAIARGAGALDPHLEALEAAATVQPALRVLTLHLRSSVSVAKALAYLHKRANVRWAVPNYIAHEASARPPFIPNDPGRAGTPGGWEQLQWNFVGEFGINAPEAWANLRADEHGGGRGVTVAVLDTGVAYSNHGDFKRSPDLDRRTFVPGYDFIGHDPYANDRNGHGTFVASTIAEATNNGRGLTGLAYGARLMPVRVLNAQGEGEATTIAKGVMFAVAHGAQVINMSLEFSRNITSKDIPQLTAAIHYAYRHGVVIVAAAGNEGSARIPYPARDRYVISVGATTEHGCLASYSNYGRGVALVAPGGGPDANLPSDPDCRPGGPAGRDVFQVTFKGSSRTRFGMPAGYEGTSMACPDVAATAALIIASGILGAHPTPAQIKARLLETARPLGDARDHSDYGAGLLDAAAATEPISAKLARPGRAAALSASG